LQGAGVGGHDNAFDPLPHQLLGGVPRLGVTEFGQAGIDNAGIAAGGAEMQVEFALAMTQQDHAVAITEGPIGRQVLDKAPFGANSSGFRLSWTLRTPICALLRRYWHGCERRISD
jgi:hypothetical protein